MAAAEIPRPLRSASSVPVLLPHLLSMPPEIHQPPPPLPSLLLFDDDDDGFGDFTFASNFGPAAPPPDDEWGDFVSSPIGSRDPRPSEPTAPSSLLAPVSDPAPPPANGGGKAWERPSGALPLSLFGDEEAEEDESPEKADLIFGNGLSSSASSGRGKDADGLGSKRDLKDLIVNLYGHAQSQASCGANGSGTDVAVTGGANGVVPEVGDDGDEEDFEWEFQVAFTSDDGVKNGEKLLQIPGDEKKADAKCHGFEVNNRLEDSQQASSQLRFGKIEHNLFDIYADHDGISNGFNFGSVAVDNNFCVAETSQENKSINNGNTLQPTSENDENSDGDNWEFQDAFSEVEDVTGFLGHEKISDTEAKLPVGTAKIQGAMDMWENNLGDLTTSSYSDDRKDPEGPENGSDISCGPTSAESGSKFFDLQSVVDFKDTISNLYNNDDQLANSAHSPSVNGQKPLELGHQNIVNDASNLNEIRWELHTTSITANSSVNLDQCISTEPMKNTPLDMYLRLKEDCLFLIVHHIDDFQRAPEIADVSDEHEREINEEVQEAYRKIQEAKISEDIYRGKYPSRDVCVSQLLEVIKEPHFKAFEQEYHLQERILSAEKDLNAAMELLKHAILVVKIFEFASKMEQHAYIIAWYKMAKVCAQELQHGAIIWAESLNANVSTQILCRGNKYFLALGEIYRATEILRASLELFKPWILSSRGHSTEVITYLDKCAELWMSSGLEKALESISDATNPEFVDRAKTLLKSTRDIQDLSDSFLTDAALSQGNKVCKLSLLPIGALPDMGSVVWNGEHYYVKLANLWANRISSDPAQLPQIHVN